MQNLLFVGTLNVPTSYFPVARGNGLSVHFFDDESLTSTQLATAPQIVNPTFLTPRKDGSVVYANSEIDGWYEGLVTALAFDRGRLQLRHINMQPTLGAGAAHNAISRDGGRLLVVNYGAGDQGPDQALVAFDLAADGALVSGGIGVSQAGQGPNRGRQDRSHPHSVIEIEPDLLLVADLGADTLTLYALEEGRFVRVYQAACESGAGPRHMALHPSRHFVFVTNELNSTVAGYRFDRESRSLAPIVSCSTMPAGTLGINHVSDLQISADGAFLYAANRGHDSLVVFAVDAENGSLTVLDIIPCGGRTPRHLAITPRGAHLLCANQDSDRVQIFARNEKSGLLVDTGASLEIGTPMCVHFTETS